MPSPSLTCKIAKIFPKLIRTRKHDFIFKSFSVQSLNKSNKRLRIHESVRDALVSNEPVVALESTIITHGMPYPENIKTALEVEDILKEKSVVPATIAVLDGEIHVGLSHEQHEKLATCKSPVKISRRGLPASISFQQTGGTTVSATMMISHWCGIPIFVTGGIGGVHRNAEDTFDISSDLTELGRTPIAVISAGVKSILDIPRTLEYLETQGVTVATYGTNRDFPAFFTRSSGCKSQLCLKSPVEAAKMIHAARKLNMDSGCLIAVPIPEKDAASGQEIEAAIQQALAEAKDHSVLGADVTPFILGRVNELTDGRSLKANGVIVKCEIAYKPYQARLNHAFAKIQIDVSLIKNNASIGADIACELSSLNSDSKMKNEQLKDRPVVIGGTNIDIIGKCKSQIHFNGPTNPASISYSLGGVGRNIAEGLSRLGNQPVFISALGEDAHARLARERMDYLDQSFIEKFENQSSGLYNAIMDDKGNLEVAIGDDNVHERIIPEIIKKNEKIICESSLVCMDATLPVETISYICELCKSNNLRLFFEPTGSLRAMKPFQSTQWRSIKYLSPNLQEFEVIMSAITGRKEKINLNENSHFSDAVLQKINENCRPLLEHVYCLIVTLGKNGVATFVQDENTSTGIRGSYYPLTAMPKLAYFTKPVVNVSGSGDTFSAAFIHGLIAGKSIDVCTKMGIIASQYTLRCDSTVSENLNKNMFDDIEERKWETCAI